MSSASPGAPETSSALPLLFSPLQVGPITLRNRILSTAHQTNLVEEHVPTSAMAAYHEARARGGIGLIVLEACAVHPSGLLTIHTIDGTTERVVPAYAAIAAAVHPHGAAVFAQLFHGGREIVYSTYRHAAYAPSAVPTDRFHIMPRPLDRADIDEIITGYGRGTALARQAGLDGVELCASHGYLPAQFWSPSTNQRDDEYGGSLENRVRFALRALEAMNAAAGGAIAVGMRVSIDELTPTGMRQPQTLEVLDYLVSRVRLDFINVIGGSSATYRASSYIVPPILLAHADFTAHAAAVKGRVPMPVFVGSRIGDPRDAEEILRRGDADVVGMTRAMIVDPQMPVKARAGRFEEIHFCLGCNQACIGHYHKDLPIGCVQNPAAGHEQELATLAPPARRKRVLVVGGGPGGMHAAIAATERGHRVTLMERGRELGGQLLVAARAPTRREVAETALDNYRRDLKRLGVEVRLGTTVTPEVVHEAGADAVILAVGSRPYVPDLPGIRSRHVLGVAEVLAGVQTGRSIAVLDWAGDWPGLDAADLLASVGKRVTLVSSTLYPGEALHQYVRNVYLERMYRLGVTMMPHHEPVAVQAGAVTLRNQFTHELITLEGVDNVVLSLGRVADTELYDLLKGQVAELYQIGDCLSARTMEEATYEAMRAALAL